MPPARARWTRRSGLATAALAFIACAGCAGWEDFDPPVQRDIPEGPGLFSGERGELAVEVDVRQRDPAEDDPTTEAEPRTGEPDDDDERHPAGSADAP
jgi:hypothetical protein